MWRSLREQWAPVVAAMGALLFVRSGEVQPGGGDRACLIRLSTVSFTGHHLRLSYGSIDALFELHGHVRAANPHSDVRVFRFSDLGPDDLASHLVIVGGPDWNDLARRIPELVPDFPVRQVSDLTDPRHAYFEVPTGDGSDMHRPVLSDDDELIWDVGLF